MKSLDLKTIWKLMIYKFDQDNLGKGFDPDTVIGSLGEADYFIYDINNAVVVFDQGMGGMIGYRYFAKDGKIILVDEIYPELFVQDNG